MAYYNEETKQRAVALYWHASGDRWTNSVREICRQVGCSTEALYQWIGDKRRGERPNLQPVPEPAQATGTSNQNVQVNVQKETAALSNLNVQASVQPSNQNAEPYREEVPPNALPWEPPKPAAGATASATTSPSQPSTSAPLPRAASGDVVAPCPLCKKKILYEPADLVEGATVVCPECRRKFIVRGVVDT